MSDVTAEFQITHDDHNITTACLSTTPLIVGRGEQADIQLSHSSVSRRHAELSLQGDRPTLTDLGSANGTYLNGNLIEEKTPIDLKIGDVIYFGDGEAAVELLNVIKPVLTPGKTAPSSPSGFVLLRSDKTERFSRVIAEIRVVGEQGMSETYQIGGSPLIIGQNRDVGLRIDHESVSSQHAKLSIQGDRAVIEDLGSANGTYVNGETVHPGTPHILNPGDILFFGESPIEVDLIQVVPVTIENIPIDLTLKQGEIYTIGRNPSCQLRITHPTVSNFHAQIAQRGDAWAVIDLKSTNGTFLEGRRLSGTSLLKPGSVIQVGTSTITFHFDTTDNLYTVSLVHNEGKLGLAALNLNKSHRLRNVSLAFLPGEFAVIAGVSGGGKSTLLKALCKLDPADKGAVYVVPQGDKPTNLYLQSGFDQYRSIIGYVPQQDIIHKTLTVNQALSYATKLRLPQLTGAQCKDRVREVVDVLALTGHENKTIDELSGGQLKRVSVGVELLADPSLFFLDEATSGLDPGTEADMMMLLKRLAKEGKVVLLVTHATNSLDQCDLIVFLAKGGRIVYFGPQDQACSYFKKSSFNQIYKDVQVPERIRPGSSEEKVFLDHRQQEFEHSSFYQSYVSKRLSGISSYDSGDGDTKRYQPPSAQSKQLSLWRQVQQFGVLTQRNLHILVRDRWNLFISLSLVPILGILDFFSWKTNLFDVVEGDASQVLKMLFVASISAIMVGGLSSMREIVKEKDIFQRERMVFLEVMPYIGSKVVIGIVVSLVQAVLFLIFKSMFVPSNLEIFIGLYITFFLTVFGGYVMGLLVSALSPNSNVAPLLIILVIVVQITLGGLLIPIKDMPEIGKLFSHVTFSRWSFESLVTTTEMGMSVANDSCFKAYSLKEREVLDEEELKRCTCYGENLFKQCNFPGVKRDYDQAILERPAPEKPTLTGDAQGIQETLQEMENWAEAKGEWQRDREQMLGPVEGMIDQMYEQFGHMFAASEPLAWARLLGISGMMTVLIILIISRA
jgi:ABC-type multidrug transport system ATPase subunit/pSer/pThr/pTyr-binding forkhead associated (FHA) protein